MLDQNAFNMQSENGEVSKRNIGLSSTILVRDCSYLYTVMCSNFDNFNLVVPENVCKGFPFAVWLSVFT